MTRGGCLWEQALSLYCVVGRVLGRPRALAKEIAISDVKAVTHVALVEVGPVDAIPFGGRGGEVVRRSTAFLNIELVDLLDRSAVLVNQVI